MHVSIMAAIYLFGGIYFLFGVYLFVKLILCFFGERD